MKRYNSPKIHRRFLERLATVVPAHYQPIIITDAGFHGPWLLATSLSPRQWPARRVVRAYEKRMQIEETFRDLKSHRWGYGLQFARSRSSERLANLLLVTTLPLPLPGSRGWLQRRTVGHVIFKLIL